MKRGRKAMQLLFSWGAVSVLGIWLSGCSSSIPIASDYGMTKTQMWHTPGFAWINPRTPRVRAQRLSSNHFVVELPALSLVAAEQEGRDWCWALPRSA